MRPRGWLAVGVLVALGGAALLLGAGSASAKVGPKGAVSAKLQGRVGKFGGVVPAVPLANAPRQTDAPQGSGDLVYHNGPVMRTNTTYAIYWLPSGYSFNGNNSGYESTINQFFADVAADSGETTNVYATDPQYYDNLGGTHHPAAYQSTFGGSVVVTDALPPSGCAPGAVPGYTACLIDSQLQAEIESVVAAQGWPRDLAHAYFLMTPPGIATCFDSNANDGCSYDDYCAYHGDFHTPTGTIVYANQPYTYNVPWPQNPASLACDLGTDYPNGASTGADPTINVISHEHNESITDPTVSDYPNPTGWWDAAGFENGDKCAWGFGPVNGTAGSRYNQVINGHHYLLQEEYDNASHDCVQNVAVPPTVASFSPASAVAGTNVTINGARFGSSPTVRFAGSSADATLVSHTASTIVAQVPNDAENGPITVSTPGGDAASGTIFKPRIKITGFDQLSYQAGDHVVVSGSNFLANGPLIGTVGSLPVVINPLDTTATTFEFDIPNAAVTNAVSVTNLNGGIVSSTPSMLKIRPRIDTGPTPDHAGAGAHVVFTGATFTGTTSVKFNNVVPATFTIGAGGTILNVTVGAGAVDGPVSITNAGGTTQSSPFGVDPHITSLLPLSAAGGSNVTIMGSGFGPSPTVTFAGSAGPAAIVSSTPTKIVATVPADAQLGPIDVSNGAHDALTTSFKPTIKILSVDQASYQAGDQVTVSGMNFLANGPLTVKVGTQPQTLDTLVPAAPPTATSLSFHLTNATTTGALSIKNASGTVTSAPGFVKVRPTVLSGPTPDHALIGKPIEFAGYTFQGTTSVKFNGTIPALFTIGVPDVNGVRKLKVTVPAGAVDGPVMITNAGGTTSTAALSVLPHVTSLLPVAAPAGASVTIMGTGFGTSPAVRFAGSAADAPLVSATGTKIVVTTPSDAQNGPIRVTTASGDAFTAPFKPSMRVTSFDQPFYHAGDTVTVSGTNFLATGVAPTAKVGLLPLAPFNVTATSLQLTLPNSAPYALTGLLTLANLNGATSTAPNPIKIRAHVDTFPSSATTRTHIVITGNTFTGTTSVKFANNTVAAALFTIGPGGTSLNVRVPIAAKTGPIGITNAGGTELTLTDFHVVPHIVSFTPTHGPAGTLVTITGTGLAAADQVFFHAGPSQTVGVPTSSSTTTIKVPVPVGAATGKLQVHTLDGLLSSLSTGAFTVP